MNKVRRHKRPDLKKYCEGYKEEICSEAHLEKFLLKNWSRFFNFQHIATRKRIGKGAVVDFLAKDDNFWYILELKHRPFRFSDLKQVGRYRRVLGNIIDPEDIRVFFVDYNYMTQEINVYIVNS